MEKKKVTAIFDIGKTNKKFFLFDSTLKEVYREYVTVDEISDEDGYPCENIEGLESWIKEVFHRILVTPKYKIISLNFSCYGASLVHIDEKGNRLSPLYNYLKPLKEEVITSFYNHYGPEDELSRITGSSKLGMLNSGMQLYWLKKTKPKLFSKIKYSLHLPQYLSYLFTGIPVSDYTSIGCHTMLWDYKKEDYHSWVYEEGLNEKLAPITPSNKRFTLNKDGNIIQVGIGIHDSSSALLPYIYSNSKPFLLVSTGTWSISINPFNKNNLTLDDIKNETLFNMRTNGSAIRVSRLFLGNEYKIQVKALVDHFKVSENYHKTIKFNKNVFADIINDFRSMFKWAYINSSSALKATNFPYDTYEYAYHHLMIEIVLLQEKSIRSVIYDEQIEAIFIDGGFSDNDIYIQLLSYYFKNMNICKTDLSIGSALGAALVISKSSMKSKFLEKNYSLNIH